MITKHHTKDENSIHHLIFGIPKKGTHSVAVIIDKVDMAIRVQILNEAVCISHNTNTLEKDMNPIIHYPAMSK